MKLCREILIGVHLRMKRKLNMIVKKIQEKAKY